MRAKHKRTWPHHSHRSRKTTTSEKAGLYRSRNGVLFGVCKGVADYLDFSVFWTRALVVGIMIFTGLWPMIGIYLLAALLMKPEPVIPFGSESDQEFYNSFTSSRTMAINRLKRTFENLDRRLKRMEDIVTGKEYDWNRRFYQK